MASDLEIHQSPLRIFDVEGEQMRFGIDERMRPYVIAVDIARRLGYRDAANALRQVEEDEKGTQILSTPGGPQQMWVVYKDGIWELIFRSSKSEAKAIKKRVKAILNEIGETGSYGKPKPPVPDMSTTEGQLLILDMARQAVLKAQEMTERAEKAEGFKRAIEAGDGLQLRAFHKKYFSTTPERVFFDHLYAKGILINQRGKGPINPKTGEPRDGRQHRHPAAKGKEFLYLHSEVDRFGQRQENSRVRPGDPELAFRNKLASQGLIPNEEPACLFELETIA